MNSDLEKLIREFKGQTLEKEYKYGSVSVKLRTLLQGEKDEIVSRVVALNAYAEAELMKRPILGYSIVAINGIKIESQPAIYNQMANKEEKKPLHVLVEEFLWHLDPAVVDKIFSLYEQLLQERAKEVETIKNSSADHSDAPSGDSSKK